MVACASVLAVLVLSLQAQAPAQEATRVLVYLDTPLSTQTLRHRLRQHWPSAQLTVYGRLRDFRRAAQSQPPPEVVLARRPVLESLGLPPHLQGLRNGVAREPYVLLSREQPVPLANVRSATIGAVDLLGPREMQAFVTRLLSGASPRFVRRVTKPEDLVGMLRLGLAQAVLVPERMVSSLSRDTQMRFALTNLPEGGVGLPAAHVAHERLQQVVRERLQGLGPELNRSMGVDEWR